MAEIARQPWSFFYNNPLFSDVELRFSGTAMPCHRPYLGLKSSYFYHVFSGNFVVAQTRVLDLGYDDDPECIRDMLKHIYGYPLGEFFTHLTRGSVSELIYHAKLFDTADKYDIPDLRALILQTRWDNLRVFPPEMYDNPIFLNTIGHIFNHVGDARFKQVVASALGPRVVELFQTPGTLEMLRNNGSMAYELLSYVADRVWNGRRVWTCRICGDFYSAGGAVCTRPDCEPEQLQEHTLWD